MIENSRARRANALMQHSTYLSRGVAPATRAATRHYEAREISNEAILPHMVPQQRVKCLLPPSRFKKEGSPEQTSSVEPLSGWPA